MEKVERAIELLNEYRQIAIELGVKAEGLAEIDSHLESLEVKKAEAQTFS